MNRYLIPQVKKDLARKMVFVGGPRQVGKTTMAKSLLAKSDVYLNWDVPEHREIVLRRELPNRKCLIIFDELHKYRGWRNYLKGLYDDRKDKYRILVTGSAKMDVYRHGGDSLQGRYHYLRLHPLSLAELGGGAKTLFDLMTYGGFPEPFFARDLEESKRWSLEYRHRLVREDITSLERIQDLGRLEHLIIRLPELVGSPLSINALREDLQVNHKTAANWLDVLERLYAIFRLAPFGAPKIKAVKKEQKHYHFDWSLIPDEGLRFENLVACHLLKWVNFQMDAHGRDMELRYFRDVMRREVDFVVTEDRKPVMFIEAKLADQPVHPGLIYLKSRFPKVDAWQIALRGKKDFLSRENIHVCPAENFLKTLA